MAERLGVTPAYYGRLEKRDKLLSIQQIQEIAEALEIPPEYLFVDSFSLIQDSAIQAMVFFETTIISWIKESIVEILSAFDTDLKNNLIIHHWEDKLKLGSILIELGKKRISTINILVKLDDLVFGYLRDFDLIISKADDKIIGTLLNSKTTQAKHGFLIKKS